MVVGVGAGVMLCAGRNERVVWWWLVRYGMVPMVPLGGVGMVCPRCQRPAVLGGAGLWAVCGTADDDDGRRRLTD